MTTSLLVLDQKNQAILRYNITDGSVDHFVNNVNNFPDGIAVDKTNGYVYWTNMGVPELIDKNGPLIEKNLNFHPKNGSLERIRLDGTAREYLLPEGSFVTGKQLTIAPQRGRLYWSDREGNAVRSVNLDGTDLCTEIVTTGASEKEQHPVGIAIDEQNGYLYWTQKGPSKGNAGRIFRTELDTPPGKTPENRDIETLWSSLPEPIDLELDTEKGIIYWTDRGAPPQGNTLNKALIPAPGDKGGEITIIASNFNEAIGLAINTRTGTAYVTDLGDGHIRAVKLDGSGEEIFAKTNGSLTGIALI